MEETKGLKESIMRLNEYKKLAQRLIDDIRFYELNKDYFKGVDDNLNDENNAKSLAKIADDLTELTKTAFQDAVARNKPVDAVEVTLSARVTPSGELRSCVEIAEEVLS